MGSHGVPWGVHGGHMSTCYLGCQYPVPKLFLCCSLRTSMFQWVLSGMFGICRDHLEIWWLLSAIRASSCAQIACVTEASLSVGTA